MFASTMEFASFCSFWLAVFCVTLVGVLVVLTVVDVVVGLTVVVVAVVAVVEEAACRLEEECCGIDTPLNSPFPSSTTAC